MHLRFSNIIIGVSIIQSVSLRNVSPVIEICDIEGSGIGDCPTNEHCCKQSACEELYTESLNSGERCCNQSEIQENPTLKECRLCTECCNEVDRNTVPLPQHCSKCRSCDNLLAVETEIVTSKI